MIEINLNVAGCGFRYDALVQVFLRWSEQQPVSLTLLPEPDNQFDPNAVAVVAIWPGGAPIHFGYIPKTDSERTTRAFNECRIKGVELLRCGLSGGGKRGGWAKIRLNVEPKAK